MGGDARKRRVISAGQWLAARAISEGAPPTRRRVAAVLGCDDSAVYGRAALEGWSRIDYRRPVAQAAHAEFIAAISGEFGGGFDGLGDGDVVLDDFASDRVMPDESDRERPDASGAVARGFDPDWAEREDVAARARPAPTGDDAEPELDGEDAPAEMLARGARFMSRRLGRLMRRAERGGGLNKTEIDNLTALGRMMERWETLAAERAKEEETTRDDKLAEALHTVNRRILRLARAQAERLLAAGFRPGDDAGSG